MSLMIMVTEIDLSTSDYEHVRYIRFPLDGKDQFNYRSRMSYNAFAHSMKSRNKSDRFLYACKHEDEWKISNECFEKTLKEYGLEDNRKKVPIVDVENLWEFYKLIGYDYKTKKYATVF